MCDRSCDLDFDSNFNIIRITGQYIFIGADSMGPAGLGPPQSQSPGAHHKVEPPNILSYKI